MKLSGSYLCTADLWLGLAFAFCCATAFGAPAEVPARLIQSSEASRLELQEAVAQLLQVSSVVIAGDALTGESLMVISKAKPRDARGLQLSGRDFDKPEPFQLVKTGDVCVLVRLRTGARATLRKSHCEPIGGDPSVELKKSSTKRLPINDVGVGQSGSSARTDSDL